MSTSAIDRSRLFYLISAAVCALFALVYEQYSHGVVSAFMRYSCLIPAAGGFLAEAAGRLAKGRRAAYFSGELLRGAVIWLTLGSIFRGVLEIYGTTNSLLIWFRIAGLLQLAGAAFSLFLPDRARRSTLF